MLNTRLHINHLLHPSDSVGNGSGLVLAVLGAGESGVGAAILGKKLGMQVFVSDFGSIKENYKTILKENKIDFEEKKHTESKILSADIIVKSPGISGKVGICKKIKAEGKKWISEIEFASKYTNAFIIAITGSNGKTTTTALIYEMLKKAGLNVGLAGNIGDSFALQVATQNFDYYVLEISSFQLDDIEHFKPNIALLLNITPDHLDRYDGSLEKYADAKFKIFKNQTEKDILIYGVDDEIIARKLKSIQTKTQLLPFSIEKELAMGGFLQNKEIIILTDKNKYTMSINDLGLQGKHNVYNSLAAGIVGKTMGIRKEVIRESLSDFKNVEHRMEPFLKIGGKQFINDSKATNVNSTWYALESMQNPVVWIAGGIDKGNDYEVLKPLVNKKVHTIICLGTDNRNLHEAFSRYTDLMINVTDMQEAVKVAHHFANKGDNILLSPACASFDLFENYEDRGNQFKAAVRNL